MLEDSVVTKHLELIVGMMGMGWDIRVGFGMLY